MNVNILALFNQATPVAKVVLGILIVMSVFSWALIFGKWISLTLASHRIARGTKRFDEAKTLHEAVQLIGQEPSSPLFKITRLGVNEFNRTRELGNSGSIVAENVSRALQQGVGMEISRLSGSVSFLATCSNTAPFIGLFGTVWGIMTSFHAIGAMKSASLATVAPGISEALIATALGLAVAIPATIGFNIFQGRLNTLEERLNDFAGMFVNRVQREINATRPTKTAE